MNIEQLTIFINLAENLSFTQTAMKLNLSQSAVSQNISRIESQLGVTLFVRNRRTVLLTEAGKSFYHNVKPVINIYYKARQQAQQVASNGKINLCIGYSGTPWETEELPKIINKYRIEHPKVKIFLGIYSHEDLKQRLSDGDLDIILTMPDIVRHMVNINFTNLTDGRYVISFPKAKKISNKNELEIADLNGQSIIFLDTQWLPSISINLQKEISSMNKNLDIIYANNITAESAMVQSGIALGLWCNFVTASNDQSIYTLPLRTGLKPQYGIASRKEDISKTAKDFITWLRKQKIEWN